MRLPGSDEPVEAEEFNRRAQAQHAQKQTANATPSLRFSLGAPHAAFEKKLLESPCDGRYQLPLQDAQGRFFYMADYDLPNDPNHPIR